RGDFDFLVEIPGLELNDGSDALFVALEAVELHLQPVRGRPLFFECSELPRASEGQKVKLAGTAEPHRGEPRERLIVGRWEAQGAAQELERGAVGEEGRLSVPYEREQIVEPIAVEVCDRPAEREERLGRRGDRYSGFEFSAPAIQEHLTARGRRPQDHVKVAVVVEIGD